MDKLARLSDDALLSAVSTLVARDRAITASLLAHLAEVDARRLYLALGHPSMFAYAVEALHLSESAAYRRIHAARAARRFPRLLKLIARGRLHLAAVCLLAPHLTPDNFAELVAAATHRSKAQVERWLATRSGPPLLMAAVAAAPDDPLVPGRVGSSEAPVGAAPAPAAPVDELVPGRVAPAEVAVPACAAPALTPRILVRLALTDATHAKLRHAQALLGHAVPGGDLTAVVDRALDALIAQLERRKFAATQRPRKARPALRPRAIPAHVKRTVWRRDEGRCAFVSGRGRRCSARSRLEFDHVEPLARGGTAHAEGMRLLCRAHNQFEAERVFGRAFMAHMRERAKTTRSTRPGTSSVAVEHRAPELHPPAAPDPPG